MADPQPLHLWAVFDRDGRFHPWTVARTEERARQQAGVGGIGLLRDLGDTVENITITKGRT